ncbi:hypothetical protein ACE6H2_023663 [Prunus campanulata]
MDIQSTMKYDVTKNKDMPLSAKLAVTKHNDLSSPGELAIAKNKYIHPSMDWKLVAKLAQGSASLIGASCYEENGSASYNRAYVMREIALHLSTCYTMDIQCIMEYDVTEHKDLPTPLELVVMKIKDLPPPAKLAVTKNNDIPHSVV